MNKPELILPAADLHRTKYAFMYGADAVYGGLPHYSLRKAEVNFTLKTLGEAIEYAHSLNKKFYVTLNIFPKNSQINTLRKEIKKLAKLNPDAFIISDPGLIQIARKLAPKIRIHLSTQANSLNYETIKFWKSQGIRRVVLARELTLKEIKEIRDKVPGVELECFVHGAMCISYSGRCLMSSVMTGRESNQGLCTQPCRWQYKVKSKKLRVKSCHSERSEESHEILLPILHRDQDDREEYFLEESKRPNEFFGIEEDDKGTYIMNSKDLCLIEHLGELQKAGISSFKIEGRNKSEYYVAVIARAYRKAITLNSKIQNPNNKRKELKELRKEMSTLNYREYTTGFIFGKAKKGETYNDRAPIRKYNFVGVVVSQPADNSKQKTEKEDHTSSVILNEMKDPVSSKKTRDFFLRQAQDKLPSQNDKYYKIQVRNKIKRNDNLELVTPNEIIRFKIKDFYNLQGEKITEAHPGNKNSFIYTKLPKVPLNTLIRKKIIE